MTIVLLLAFASTASAANIEGLVQIFPGNEFNGAVIDTELLTVGESYTVVYNVTVGANHNGGFRARYCQTLGGGGENDTFNSAHSSAAAQPDGNTCNQVPAQWPNGTFDPDSTVDLVLHFTLGADLPDLDPPKYEKFIGLFGSQGNAAYTTNTVTVYDSSKNVLWTNESNPVFPGSGATGGSSSGGDSASGGATGGSGTTNPATGDGEVIFAALALLLSAAGVAVIVKTRKEN